jgi:hypothetical protein
VGLAATIVVDMRRKVAAVTKSAGWRLNGRFMVMQDAGFFASVQPAVTNGRPA